MKPQLVSLRGILCAVALTACSSGAPLARLRVQPLPEAASPAARELSQRAAGLAQAGNDRSAKALYQQATQGALDSDVARLNLGRLHLNLEEFDEAQQAFEKAKALNDENLAADDNRKLLNHYRHRLLFPKPLLGAEDVVSSLSGTHRTTLFHNGAGTLVGHRAIANAHLLGVQMPFATAFSPGGDPDTFAGDLQIKLRGFSNSLAETNHAFTIGTALVLGTGSEAYGLGDSHVKAFGQYGYTFGRFALTTGLKIGWVELAKLDRTGASLNYNALLGWTPFNDMAFVLQGVARSIVASGYATTRAGVLAGIRLYPGFYDTWQVGLSVGAMQLGGDAALASTTDVGFHY